MSQVNIRGILGLSIFIPLILGIIEFKKTDKTSRLFVFFIAVGAIVDLVMWGLIFFEKTRYVLLIFNCYSLVEALFFFWFLWNTAPSDSIRKISKFLMYFTIPFWIVSILIFPQLTKEISGSAAFATTYYIITSFLAGFALLQIVENEKSAFSTSSFWFTLGIFFCSFCTFYITAFLQTFLSQQVWFINNIFNIISYIFYSLGFWCIKTKPVSE